MARPNDDSERRSLEDRAERDLHREPTRTYRPQRRNAELIQLRALMVGFRPAGGS